MTGVPVERTYDWHRAVVGKVSTEALALVLVLSNRMDVDGTLPKQFTPSIETLSREMGYAANSRRAIVRAMKELEAAGFLLVKRGGGRKTTNIYRATVPALVVADQPPQTDGTVASCNDNGGAGATHPIPTNSNPYPQSDKKPTGAERDRRAHLANRVMRQVAAQVPAVEAEALGRDLAELKSKDSLRDTLAALVDGGHEARLLAELTAIKVPGFTSPYAGCEHPMRVVAARVRDLARSLGHA